jgi:ankyrin repeat protein
LLHKAITFEQNSLALKLIDRGVVVSATNKVGATALHYAVRAGNQAMVELLLSKGADIEVKDSAGSTPVEIAHAMSGRQNLSDTMGRKISSKQMNKIMSALTKLTTNK